MKPKDVIHQPVSTEKALGEQEANNYLFWVNSKATKTQIKSAAEELFKVNPVAVRTIRIGRKKKAIIKLPEGEEIKSAKLNG